MTSHCNILLSQPFRKPSSDIESNWAMLKFWYNLYAENSVWLNQTDVGLIFHHDPWPVFHADFFSGWRVNMVSDWISSTTNVLSFACSLISRTARTGLIIVWSRGRGEVSQKSVRRQPGFTGLVVVIPGKKNPESIGAVTTSRVLLPGAWCHQSDQRCVFDILPGGRKSG